MSDATVALLGLLAFVVVSVVVIVGTSMLAERAARQRRLEDEARTRRIVRDELRGTAADRADPPSGTVSR